MRNRRGLPIEELSDLRERELGSAPDFTFEQAVAATFADFDLTHPGGESSRSAQRRVVSLIEMLAARHPEYPVVLGSHGNLITLLLNHFVPDVGYEFWQSLAFPDVVRLPVNALGGGGTFSRLPPPADGR